MDHTFFAAMIVCRTIRSTELFPLRKEKQPKQEFSIMLPRSDSDENLSQSVSKAVPNFVLDVPNRTQIEDVELFGDGIGSLQAGNRRSARFGKIF